MKRLNQMVAYVIITAAKKSSTLRPFLEEMSKKLKKVYIIPTENSLKLVDMPDISGLKNVEFRNDYHNHDRLSEEDFTVVIPCTFNSFNKIMLGIADNYALSLVAATIGAGKCVYIALSMNQCLWNHPKTKQNIAKPISENVMVIWPDKKENGDMTMPSFEKIMDCICVDHQRVKFNSIKTKETKNYAKIINDNCNKLIDTGKIAFEKKSIKSNKGCIALRNGNTFLVSASGSKLGELSKDEITLISKVDYKKNKVYWCGKLEPSSETPMFAEIFRQMPKVNAIIHTHAKKLTQNPVLEKYKTKKYIRYGLLETGANILKTMKNGFCIMRDHGEVAIGIDFDDCFSKIEKIEGVINKKQL